MFDFFRKKGNNPEEPAKDGGSQNAASATASGRTTRDALAEFTATPLPDAIDGLLFRVSMADPTDPTSSSGFDAYAARLLSEAEAPSLRAIAVEHPVELRRLNTTGLFWSIFDDSTISAGNRGTILRIESVLDRLALISKALEGDEGTAFVSATTESACSELDWQVLRSIANDANDYLTAAERDNKLNTQYGTTGTRGGNWDLSTRLAAACEAMVLPSAWNTASPAMLARALLWPACRCLPPTCSRSPAGAAPRASGPIALRNVLPPRPPTPCAWRPSSPPPLSAPPSG